MVTSFPQFAVVSPYYKSSLVKVNGAAGIAATNGGSEGRRWGGWSQGVGVGVGVRRVGGVKSGGLRLGGWSWGDRGQGVELEGGVSWGWRVVVGLKLPLKSCS